MGGNVTLGGTISAAAGPIGTGGSVQSALASPAAVFSYSRSKGLYAGLSLEGTVLIERKDANKAFYGSAVPAKSILTGLVPAPEIASPLYEVCPFREACCLFICQDLTPLFLPLPAQVIEAAEGIDESTVPAQAWVPTPEGGHVPVTEGISASFAGGSSSGKAAASGSGGQTVFDASGAHEGK